MGATNVVVCDSREHAGWLSDMDKAGERRVAYWADKVWDVRCMWANYRAASIWNEALAERMLTEIQIELSAAAYGLYPDRAVPMMIADVPMLARAYKAWMNDFDRMCDDD
ncbi:hypothetical protein [Burkholderia cepacia]|uniref:hypothetical protein n=1 Tax=Burkholderia cepacia TaxID=292 RepID=UPI002AB72DBC|nr:hypothetical protein [Burkholderia cepacia]